MRAKNEWGLGSRRGWGACNHLFKFFIPPSLQITFRMSKYQCQSVEKLRPCVVPREFKRDSFIVVQKGCVDSLKAIFLSSSEFSKKNVTCLGTKIPRVSLLSVVLFLHWRRKCCVGRSCRFLRVGPRAERKTLRCHCCLTCAKTLAKI